MSFAAGDSGCQTLVRINSEKSGRNIASLNQIIGVNNRAQA